MLSINIPASKSMSHRLLMAAALAHGESIIHNVLLSKDIECTMQVLTAVGANFQHEGNSIHVRGTSKPTSLGAKPTSCYMHESGTSCRLLMAILSAGEGKFYIHGAKRMHERPMGALVKALTSLGVQINYENKENFLPLTINTTGFMRDCVDINIDESSQYLSGLLLAAPCAQQALSIYVQGKSVVSWPYVLLTLKAMEDFGIKVQLQEKIKDLWQNITWRNAHNIVAGQTRLLVPKASYISGEYTVEGDWSAASYFLAAGVVGKKSLRIQGLNKNSLQGDKAMLDILSAMQGDYAWDGSDIIVRPSNLKGINVDMGHCPDLVPTVATLAAFASGITTINNVRHLRIKESDRLAAPAAELSKVGVKVEILDDGLRVHGIGKAPTLTKGTVFSTHNDHRIAMSCALLGLAGQELITVDEPTVVQKSFPNFWELWGKYVQS